jgi:hypothetical protein
MTASKKVHHIIQILYPFPLPLSLSCYRDRERGYSERYPSLRRKRALSPPTDQGFEGWPLGRVRQLPQSTRAPRPLLVRGSKASPLKGSTAASGHSGSSPTTDQGFEGWPPEGFDSRLRTCRARDDSGYVRYMAEARATLLRYPRTFLRPAGVIL